MPEFTQFGVGGRILNLAGDVAFLLKHSSGLLLKYHMLTRLRTLEKWYR